MKVTISLYGSFKIRCKFQIFFKKNNKVQFTKFFNIIYIFFIYLLCHSLYYFLDLPLFVNVLFLKVVKSMFIGATPKRAHSNFFSIKVKLRTFVKRPLILVFHWQFFSQGSLKKYIKHYFIEDKIYFKKTMLNITFETQIFK